MENTLYLECYSGISGDMTVAALLDLGADPILLKKALSSLPLSGYSIEISRVKKSGLDVCDFSVVLEKKYENHDHNMEFLHGHAHHHGADEHHKHEDGHAHHHGADEHHKQEDGHAHHHGADEHHKHEAEPDREHLHRGLEDIIEIIQKGDISARARELAIKIFTILGEAEAKAHGVLLNQVHFHEVGAVDSIVDIVAVAVCLDNLGITKVIVPELYEGRGFVRCQHGTIPIPVPAVANIAAAHNLNLHITSTEGELVTPTGAAIVAAIKTSDQLPKRFSIEKIGIGGGKRTYDRPSMLRAMIVKTDNMELNDKESDSIYKLETNIDDSSGEIMGFVMERLFEAGARDVQYTPVFMKKNRPAYLLTVLCTEEHIEKIEDIIFQETTTIGIRRVKMERTILARELKTLQTSLGTAQVKICKYKNTIKVYPEYCSVAELGRRNNMTYQTVYQLILQEYQNQVLNQ